ncbi:MAG: hypothetical protein V1861_01115 [Candidatus Micrarchaeota archaeon]
MTVYPTQEQMDIIQQRAEQVERETQQTVSRSLSAIDVALSEWDGARSKPAALEPTIRYLRRSYDLLTGWEKESISGPQDAVSRFIRLKSYVVLCKKLESERPV